MELTSKKQYVCAQTKTSVPIFLKIPEMHRLSNFQEKKKKKKERVNSEFTILLIKNISAVTAYNYSSVKLFDFSVTCYVKHFIEDAKLFTILYLYKCGHSAPAHVFYSYLAMLW